MGIAIVMSLMNQCVGVVLMEVVLQDRLFLFVFGGQDACYQDDEHALKNVYESRLAREIWNHYWVKGERLKAIVLLATFDHYDLQTLLIKDLGRSRLALQAGTFRSDDEHSFHSDDEHSFHLGDGRDPVSPRLSEVHEDSPLLRERADSHHPSKGDSLPPSTPVAQSNTPC